jgi:hypothetical protein
MRKKMKFGINRHAAVDVMSRLTAQNEFQTITKLLMRQDLDHSQKM